MWHTLVPLSPYTLIPSSPQTLNQTMASLNCMFLAPATTTNCMITTTRPRPRRVQTFATAAKGSGGSSEEKGFLDWLEVALQKDGFVETDPILQKVDGKTGGGTTSVTSKKTTTTAAPPKKSAGGFGGFGGLFAKK